MTKETRIAPELIEEDHGSAFAALEQAGKSLGDGPTPDDVLAVLALDPGPGPVGFTVMTGEGVTLELLNSGDALGIDGRWCPVVGCTLVNSLVAVDTAYGYPAIKAPRTASVHLARVIDEPEPAS